MNAAAAPITTAPLAAATASRPAGRAGTTTLGGPVPLPGVPDAPPFDPGPDWGSPDAANGARHLPSPPPARHEPIPGVDPDPLPWEGDDDGIWC